MKKSSSDEYYIFHSLILFKIILSQSFFHRALSQQPYLRNDQLHCSNSSRPITRGYACNSVVNSCNSFVTFTSRPNHDTSSLIAGLLDSSAGDIAWLNSFDSTEQQIPHETVVIVPISCLCSGSIYQHNSRYTVNEFESDQSYFKIANDTYQGLSTCQAMSGQNYYDHEVDLPKGSEIMVPVRCACRTGNQSMNGVLSLIVYMVKEGDTIESIAKAFGVQIERFLMANEILENTTIYPFTPLLVPLGYDCCKTNPRFYFCSKSCDYSSGIHPDCASSKLFVTLIGVGSGISFFILVLIGYKMYQWLKRRRQRINKEKFFKQNGGVILQQKALNEGGERITKIFTAEELERATDNYNENRFLGQGGYGTVYKGMLQNGVIVAVKKSKKLEKTCIQQFINEVLILSQINHRNVVKLLGCCLETEFPLLVYEFVPNGKLSQYIISTNYKQDHRHRNSQSLSWENRLRIACEVASAISYMHSAASIPILHRDIKSSNILLDENYTAKVSDFGTSRFMPSDQSHLTTNVKGTLGYMDPEYFRSSKFSEKSDVYSFGVLLIELLTGKQPFSFAKDNGVNLLEHFVSLDKRNQLVELLDTLVAGDENMDVVLSVAKLATRCLKLNGKKRPTMKQVFLELEGLAKSQDYCMEFVEECPKFETSFSTQTSSSSDDDDDDVIRERGHFDTLEIENTTDMNTTTHN